MDSDVSPDVLRHPGLLEGELGQASGVVGPRRGFGRHPGLGPFPPVDASLDGGGSRGRRGPASLAPHHVLQLAELDALLLQLLAQLGQRSGLAGQLLLEAFDLALLGAELLVPPLDLQLQLVHPVPQRVQGWVFEAVVFVGSAVGGVGGVGCVGGDVRVFVPLRFHGTVPHLATWGGEEVQSHRRRRTVTFAYRKIPFEEAGPTLGVDRYITVNTSPSFIIQEAGSIMLHQSQPICSHTPSGDSESV